MTFSDMKKAKQILLDNGYTTAADIVPALTDTDLQAILAGDFSGLDQPEGKRDHHGEPSTGSAETDGRERDLTTGNGGTDGDILEDMTGGGLLPVGLYGDIVGIITGYAHERNIPDVRKIDPRQFSAACTLVGQFIKQNKILRDLPREKKQGGVYYSPEKLQALLALYEFACNDFRQTAFTYNFQRFAGVSREYFNDYCERGLTSSRVGIKQKALDIQKASLVSSISAGGSSTVGNIFLGKALAGLQESSTVVHVSASPAISSTELPALPSKS